MPAKITNAAPKPYIALINRFYLRPIRSEEELEQAIEVLDYLVDREELSRDEQDYLDVLTDLVEAYEEENLEFRVIHGPEMLKGMIEDRKLSQAEVARGAGMATTTLNDLVTGRRKMNLTHMKKLGAYFHVDYTIFLPEGEEGLAEGHEGAGGATEG
ncbi:helix-turn-helix domain-containing protein [Singulisphaera sp. PoT]|uniref:helix-turn-helix domain-containing protein n=1 Tax=Singulisphaera sp. PoT TaxID=3411797 RepID=UPI003BF4C931